MEKLKKIYIIFISFFIPLFVKKKDYNLVILRYDSEKFMFNTKAFFEYMIEKSDLNVKYIINDDTLRKKLIKKYGKHFITQKTVDDIFYIARAGTWVTDGGFPLKTPFGHKNRILINLWHGMPIKYIGIKGYKGIEKIRVWLQLKMFARYYNAFCVTSTQFIPIIQESFLLDGEKIKVLGQPRNDLLFIENNRDKILERIYRTLPAYKKIILYAPTYREDSYGNAKLEKTKFFPFSEFDIGKLEKFLEDNQYIIFIRAHHLDKIIFQETDRIRFLNGDKVSEISEILNIFDLLISDYSGMIFDFLLLNKPILLLPYDLNDYRREVGLYDILDIFGISPYVGSFGQFMVETKKLLEDDSYYANERQNMKKKVFDFERNSSAKILEFLNKELEGAKK